MSVQTNVLAESLPRSPVCGAIMWLTLSVGCTAPVDAGQLPAAEAQVSAQLGFVHAPERVVPLPPVESLSLLATNPTSPRWAASDGRRVWVGEGRQLHELARDYSTRIGAMAIDDGGALWLIEQHNRLTRIDAAGVSTQLPALPIQHVQELRVAGERVVVLGELADELALPPDEPTDEQTTLDEDFVLAVSRDQGQHWQLRRRPTNLSEFDDLSVAPDGTMQLMDGNEADCGGGWQSRWRGHLDRPGWTMLEWPLDTYDQRVAADHGWAYGLAECDDAWVDHGVCAVDRKGRSYGVLAVESKYMIIHDGVRTMMLVDDGVWSVSGRKATRVADVAPALLESGVDGSAIAYDGAVLLSTGSTIHIGSVAGWTSLELG